MDAVIKPMEHNQGWFRRASVPLSGRRPLASSSTEFYEWLIRVTTSIRAQKEPHEQDLLEIFVRELGQVLSFDHLAKYDAASNRFSWYVGPEFEELNEALKTAARNADRQTGDPKILSLWVYERQETIVLENLANEARFQDTLTSPAFKTGRITGRFSFSLRGLRSASRRDNRPKTGAPSFGAS